MSYSKKSVFLIVLVVLMLSISAYISWQYYTKKSTVIVNTAPLKPIRIIILNGCGFKGVAGEFRDVYESNENFDIIADGNAQKFIYDKSLIVVRKDNQENLQRLRTLTGIQRRIFALNDFADAEFEIILGKDYLKHIK